MGMLAGRSERNFLSAFREIGLIGIPERPPASTLEAEETNERSPFVTIEVVLTIFEAGWSLKGRITDDDSINPAFPNGNGNVRKL